jgi:hypothetical protein
MVRLLQCSAVFLSVFVPTLSIAQLEVAGCESYESDAVSLHGILTRKTFAGPPNYRDIHRGDEAEIVWLLKLESPICVDEDKVQPEINPSQRNVREVQLVLNKEHRTGVDLLLGRRIVVSGRLLGAHAAHHHTAVLLIVAFLEPAHWK